MTTPSPVDPGTPGAVLDPVSGIWWLMPTDEEVELASRGWLERSEKISERWERQVMARLDELFAEEEGKGS